MSYQQALELFGALWAEARALNPDIGRDWTSDLEADLAVARAVNGLPLDWPYMERWAKEFGKVPGRERLPAEVARLRSQ